MSRRVPIQSRDQSTALRASLSGGVEDPLSEQVQLGASIHLAFEELEPRHLAFRLSIAIGEFEGGAYSGIPLEARREALQVGQSTGQDRLDPALQLTGCPLAHHLGKGLGQRRNLGDCRIMLLYLDHVRLLVWRALLGTSHEEIRELVGGEARQGCRLGRSRGSGGARKPSWLSAA